MDIVSKIFERQFLIVGRIVNGHDIEGRPVSQRLHTAGLSYKIIAIKLKHSYTTIAEALYSTDSEFPLIKRGRKKIITPEISCYIQTLSLMDSLLTFCGEVPSQLANSGCRKCILASKNTIAID
jgi:hypothetical protein